MGQLNIYIKNNETGSLIPHTKINFKWIKDLKYEMQASKASEEKWESIFLSLE